MVSGFLYHDLQAVHAKIDAVCIMDMAAVTILFFFFFSWLSRGDKSITNISCCTFREVTDGIQMQALKSFVDNSTCIA